MLKSPASLGIDNIWKTLLRLTIPSMLAQFVNVFYSIADRIFIGNIAGIGDLALAGIGVCAPVITLLTSFSYLFAMGGAPLCAIKLGSGDPVGARKTMTNSLIMLLVSAIFVSLIFFFIRTPMLMFFGATENTIEYAKQYLTVYLCGSIFSMLSLGMNTYITAQGYSRTAMASVMVGAVVNIALDPLFIFVFKMNVVGAAIATVIAQFCSFACVVGFLASKKSSLRLSFRGFDFKLAKKMITLGISPFFIMATESVIIIALNATISKTAGANADTYVAAATIVISFIQLVIFPLGGLTMGAQPLMSYSLGAGKMNRVWKALRGLICICMIYNAIMFTLGMSAPQYFARIFTSDENIIAIVKIGVRLQVIGLFTLTFQYAIVDTFTALNEPKYAMTLSLTRKLVVMMPIMIIVPMVANNPTLVFIGEPIADIVGGILSSVALLVYYKRRKKKSDLLQIG